MQMKEYQGVACAGCGAPVFRPEDADPGMLDLGVWVHHRVACLEAYAAVVSERIRARGDEVPPEEVDHA